MKKTLTLLIAVALATSSAAQAAQLIKLATLSPLSGGQSYIGTQIRNGAALALKDLQPQFAKLGYTVQLAAYDDQADPTTGVAAARRMAADKAVLGLVGTYNSGVVIPASAVLAPLHLSLVSPANTSPVVTSRGLKNVNRVTADDIVQGASGAKFMLGTLKAKKAYFLNDKSTYGEGLAREAEKTFKANGGMVVASEGTDEKNNFGALISKIQVMKPDVIYFGGIYDQVGAFLKQLREKGVNTPLMGAAGLDAKQLFDIAGDGIRNTYYTTSAPPVATIPAAAKYFTAYKTAYKDDPQGFSLFAYDSATVMLNSMLKAINDNKGKMPTREQIEGIVRTSTTKGLSGDIKFDSQGDRIDPAVYTFGIGNDKVLKVMK